MLTGYNSGMPDLFYGKTISFPVRTAVSTCPEYVKIHARGHGRIYPCTMKNSRE